MSHTVLPGHLELASDFQIHICIRKAVPLRSSADKVSKMTTGLWSFIFFSASDFYMPKSQKTKKHLPLTLHDNQTFILCLSWDTEMQRHPKSLAVFLLIIS